MLKINAILKFLRICTIRVAIKQFEAKNLFLKVVHFPCARQFWVHVHSETMDTLVLIAPGPCADPEGGIVGPDPLEITQI